MRQDEKPLLTPREFKDRMPMLGWGSLYEFLRAGRIKSVRVGKKYLIPSSELNEFIEREAQA